MSVNNVILKAEIFNDISCTLQWFDLNHFRSLIKPHKAIVTIFKLSIIPGLLVKISAITDNDDIVVITE